MSVLLVTGHPDAARVLRCSDVRFGTLNRDRRTCSSKTVLVAQRASGFNLEIELKNIILRRVSIFEFICRRHGSALPSPLCPSEQTSKLSANKSASGRLRHQRFVTSGQQTLASRDITPVEHDDDSEHRSDIDDLRYVIQNNGEALSAGVPKFFMSVARHYRHQA